MQHGSCCLGGYISLLCLRRRRFCRFFGGFALARELCISIAKLWLAELADEIIAPAAAAAAEVIYADGTAQAETNWISSIVLELGWREIIFPSSGPVACR